MSSTLFPYTTLFRSKELKDVANNAGEKDLKARVENALGNYFWGRDDMGRSLEHHLAAATFLDKADESALAGEIFENIGDDYQSAETHTQAISAYKIALKIREKLSDDQGEAETLCDLGTSLERL